jgi:DNA-binding SARP family transcriptional activator/streptogramin lyase
MQFKTLGGLEVWEDGHALQLTPGRQRAFLSLLLLHPNEVISTERLVSDFWGDEAPATAAKVIQGYVSRLRRELPPGTIETHGSGYLLHVADTDVGEFERLLALAREEGRAEAARTLRGALELWRGRPYADVEYEPWAQSEIGRLEELRIVALEERIEADIELGRHADAVAELETLVAANPLREQLRGLLMLALYRSGRQAEALEAYRAARHALVDELGIEPSRELQDLERRILAQDTGLDGPRRAAVRPGRRRDAALIAIGVLLLAGALTAGIRELTGRNTPLVAPPNSVAAIEVGTDRVRSVTPVGNTPTAVVYGGGAVWALNSDEHTITRIDPGSGQVQRTIPTVVPPSNLAVIDPANPLSSTATALPGSTSPVLQGAPSWVAADRATVWATTNGALWRVAPAPRRRTFSLGLGCCGPLAIGGGSVWVVDDQGLVRIDARSGQQTATVALPFRPARVAVGLGGVWVTNARGSSVWRIDPNRNAVAGTISVGPQPSGIALGAGSVWIASADGTVARIDPTAGKVTETLHVGGTPSDLSFAAQTIWVAVD